MTSRHGTVETALGPLTLTARDDALTGLYFPQHWHPPTAEALGEPVDAGEDALFRLTAEQLGEYLAGTRHEFELPMRPVGEAFQLRVWAVLAEIPYGATTSYGAIARGLGDVHLSQRVGQAVGRNPISIVVPCHRVLGADGRLTGYAGGLERKRMLLDLERPVATDALF